MYSIGMASALFGVCIKTLRRWDTHKKIKCFRTAGGHRRFSIEEIRRILTIKEGKTALPSSNKKRPQEIAIYARVSSHKQQKRGDLARQIEALTNYANQNKLKVSKIYKDIGSGLNTNRKGLWRLFQDAKKEQFGTIILNFKDRLTGFGYQYLQQYFAEFGVNLLCINQLDEKAPESELVEDLVAIVHSFSGKLYRMRRSEKESNTVSKRKY